MSGPVSVLKDEHRQRPIPSLWRNTLSDIAEALKEGDFSLEREVAGVRPISTEDATRIASNIKSYGARLTSLPATTWETSACQWTTEYWDVLVDLFTVEEGASDLVLAVRVYEDGSGYSFEIQSVHVP
jgi:hypothetical protein